MIPDRRRLLAAVDGEREERDETSGLDPIEAARRELGRGLVDVGLDEPLPAEAYDRALVRLVRAARAFRRAGEISAKSDVGLELVLALDEVEETGRALTPDVCRECGCVEDDACLDESGVPCAWNDASRTLCTVCDGRDGEPG